MDKKDETKISAEQAADVGALRERVEQRAYELYEQRGREDGFDAQDWLRAEQEIAGQTERVEASAADETGEGRGRKGTGAKAAKQS